MIPLFFLLGLLAAKISQYYFLSQAYKTSSPVIRKRVFWVLMTSFATDVPMIFLVLYLSTH